MDKTTNEAYTACIVNKHEQLSPIETLLALTSSYLDASQQVQVTQALMIATQAHKGHFRLDNSPYVYHAVAVAQQLAEWHAPAEIVAAGLLHDVLKPNYASGTHLPRIEAKLGVYVAQLVKTVSKLGRFGAAYPAAETNPSSVQMEIVTTKMPWVALMLQRSPWAVIIKLADKLHNFQTLDYLPEKRQNAFASSTMGVFVPFAERLGLRVAKQSLEDSSFAILQPEQYRKITQEYPLHARQEVMLPWISVLQEALQNEDLIHDVSIDHRSFFGLYRREMAENKSIPLTESDALLIVTMDEPSCYLALRAVHQLWSPKLTQFWDYIATPKPNGYRALHTGVRLPSGESLLVVIRDMEMDVVADFGITAVWQGIPVDLSPTFMAWREPPKGEIGVLTPDGDFKTLMKGATPIDFAYAIHIGLGHQCTGALVNGRQVPLDRQLETGDVVRILTGNANVGPSPEWLTIVQTNRAKQAIRKWLKSQKPGDAAEEGWLLLDEQLRQAGMILSSSSVLNQVAAVAQELGYTSRDSLLVAIGLHQCEPQLVVQKLVDEETNGETQPVLQATIVSLGDSDLPQKLASCCHPLPPDPIVAYQTKQDVLTIHRADCQHVQRLRPLIQAEWSQIETVPEFEIHLLAVDRPGLVKDVSIIITESAINMSSFHADQMPDGSARIVLGMGDMDSGQREHLLNRLQRIPDIRRVHVQSPTLSSHFPEQSVMAKHFDNPYSLRPVTGESFYGRRAELRNLIDNLRNVRPGEAVLLWGPRRIGKTSLLKEFQQRVMNSEDYILAFVDMQRLSGRSITMFLRDIMKEISRALNDPRTKPPNLSRMKRDPLGYFRGFLENAPALQDKYLVIILDEFQLLSNLQDDKVTLADINRYFRSLIQHRGGLSIIFSGGGVLDHLLKQPEASFMLEVARHQKVGSLEPSAARDLIVRPARRIRYDEAVVQGLLDLTDGHPYYLQWICGELILRADRAQRPFIGQEQLDEILTDWMPLQGEQFFNHLWGSSTGFSPQQQADQKLILTILAEHAPKDGWMTPERIEKFAHSEIGEGKIWHILQDLFKMDTLAINDGRYRIRMPLFEKWMCVNYSVERVLRERKAK